MRSVPSPNDQPLDDFEGLTPRQVHHLFHDFLGAGSMVKLVEAPAHPAAVELPLLRFATDLLDELAKAEIRLTAKGNLPGKLVKACYATGRLPDYAIERGITRLSGEDDYLPLQVVKHVLLQLGWMKKRNNRLSLTAKGKKARHLPPTAIFRDFLLTHLRKFNLGWSDGYPQHGDLQYVAPYLFYLLLLLGGEQRPVEDYTRRLRKAFPHLAADFPGRSLDQAASVRLFERCLAYYGLVGLSPEGDLPAHVVATDHFRSVFYLDPDARPEPPSEEEQYQRQLKTALFDAEMGSQSYFSDDMPLEMVEAFQQQIREFEAQGETVRIGDLLGTFPLVPPDDIPDEETARREAERIINALQERRILLLDSEEAQRDAFSFYGYLHGMLLNHEIVPPTPNTTRVVLFDEVFLANIDPVEALTEAFLLALFDLGNPFPADLLASRVRLDNRVVPRERALRHLNSWRNRYQKITPLAFEIVNDGPQIATPSDQQSVQFYLVAYEVLRSPGGTPKTFDGAGVVEAMLEDNEWRITGARFPGFEF
ncbi:hypothetical protein GGR26_000183 [Lewinella marina]|uniref:Uncharacterized protein n=1 Tax=Neolewinella marina TaxID=438751 RepID=A0A2G0CK72_9BACT|nr:hypothetical protein [Neolewinella marina]NJB84438.1 hypothetical protein [Neolewinella marina]PHL00369.1 hypothetical protein CGL56_04865 [Neolewinella marina]